MSYEAIWRMCACMCIIKGLSTAECGRGHVTAHTYSVTVKVQRFEADILKIVCKDSELYDVRDNLQSFGLTAHARCMRRPASGFVVVS